MEDVYVRYPTVEYRTYRPGSKGLNIHYKGYREAPFGMKGKLRTSIKDYHRTVAVSGYVDQRGVNTFAYKIPDAKQHRAAPFMDRLPRGGLVPRIVGSIGDVENSFVDPNPAIAAALAAAAKANATGAAQPTPPQVKPADTLTTFGESTQSFNQPPVNDPKPNPLPPKVENIDLNPLVESSHNSLYASASSLGYETAPQSAASSQYFDPIGGGGDGGLYGDDNAFNYGLSGYNGEEKLANPTEGNPANNANSWLNDPLRIKYEDFKNSLGFSGQNDVQDGPNPSLQIVTDRRDSYGIPYETTNLNMFQQRHMSYPGPIRSGPTTASTTGPTSASTTGPPPASASSSGSSNIETLHDVKENGKTTTKSLNQMTGPQLMKLLDSRFIEYDKNESEASLRAKMVNYYYFKHKAKNRKKVMIF